MTLSAPIANPLLTKKNSMSEIRNVIFKFRGEMRRLTDHFPKSITVSHDVYAYMMTCATPNEVYFEDGNYKLQIAGVRIVPGS